MLELIKAAAFSDFSLGLWNVLPKVKIKSYYLVVNEKSEEIYCNVTAQGNGRACGGIITPKSLSGKKRN